MYKKMNEEKIIVEEDMVKLEALIERYEKQVKIGTNTLKTNQENLQVARDDLQALRLENINLKNKINDLQKRNEELFAQVNAIV
jgi:chromosome segregation ATPase